MVQRAKTLNFNNFLFLFVLAVLANGAYCAAYQVDLFVQFSHYRDQRGWWRRGIAAVGFTFAAALTYFLAAGLFGYPDFF